MNGAGCPTCAIQDSREKVRMKFSEFVDKVSIVHNGKYTYVRSSFTHAGGRVEIVCPYHGNFELGVYTHLVGSGCPTCSKEGALSERYDQLVPRKEYNYLFRDGSDMWLVHTKCGRVFKNPITRVGSNTKYLCPACAVQSVTEEVFLERARMLFGEEYEYSNFTTIGSNVTIHHKKCGNTSVMKASTHVRGNYGKGVGCPYCATYGFSKGRDAFLYVLQAPNGYTKVGITHQEVIGRIRQISKSTKKMGWVFTEVYKLRLSGEDAITVEKKSHKYLDELYKKPVEKFDGSSETYVGVDLDKLLIFIQNFIESASINPLK